MVIFAQLIAKQEKAGIRTTMDALKIITTLDEMLLGLVEHVDSPNQA